MALSGQLRMDCALIPKFIPKIYSFSKICNISQSAKRVCQCWCNTAYTQTTESQHIAQYYWSVGWLVGV